MTVCDQDWDMIVRIDARLVWRTAPKDMAEEAIRAQANIQLRSMARNLEQEIVDRLSPTDTEEQ